ncbi:hypothetical protein LIA77_03034 [Sarocladium implicatum]|nr:hypothetical protein LIA77_03034 [Sarocladium implicatum]
MKLVIVDYETVRRDNEPGPPTRFNTSFCEPDTLPHPVTIPSETPYAFSRWLPHIARSRCLAEDEVQVVKLTRQQALLIIEASTASIITGVVSRAHREDLEDEVYPVFSSLTYPDKEQGLWMRLEGCSPKGATCVLHKGLKPQALLLSTEDIILRLVTSERAVKNIKRYMNAGAEVIPVFFLPFNARMGSDREYRVFCRPGTGRISAISQYQWHKPWKFKEAAADRERMNTIVERISKGAQFLQEEIMAALRAESCEEDILMLEQGFSFDAFYDEDADEVQLVELNVYGARSGLGSCLFNWSQDFDVLYGEKGTDGEFRITF